MNLHSTAEPARYPALEKLAFEAAFAADAERTLALNVLTDLARTYRPPEPEVSAWVVEALRPPVICAGVRSGNLADCRCGRNPAAR
jgi:hypothetical protein